MCKDNTWIVYKLVNSAHRFLIGGGSFIAPMLSSHFACVGPPIEDNGSCRKSRRHNKKTSSMLSFAPDDGSCEGEESSPQLKPVNICERRGLLTENGTKGVK